MLAICALNCSACSWALLRCFPLKIPFVPAILLLNTCKLLLPLIRWLHSASPTCYKCLQVSETWKQVWTSSAFPVSVHFSPSQAHWLPEPSVCFWFCLNKHIGHLISLFQSHFKYLTNQKLQGIYRIIIRLLNSAGFLPDFWIEAFAFCPISLCFTSKICPSGTPPDQRPVHRLVPHGHEPDYPLLSALLLDCFFQPFCMGRYTLFLSNTFSFSLSSRT